MKKTEATAEQYKKIQPRYKKLPILTKKQKKELGIGKDLGRASLSNIRVSTSKACIMLDLIRGRKLAEAKAICRSVSRKSSLFILKLLDSAEANAVNNNELDKNLLYVAEAYADQGPTLKRIHPRAQGRTYRILKRTCQITLVLKEQK
jgi:large subunit ribosomal protein L22